jgi:hypothetical protein
MSHFHSHRGHSMREGLSEKGHPIRAEVSIKGRGGGSGVGWVGLLLLLCTSFVRLCIYLVGGFEPASVRWLGLLA